MRSVLTLHIDSRVLNTVKAAEESLAEIDTGESEESRRVDTECDYRWNAFQGVRREDPDSHHGAGCVH